MPAAGEDGERHPRKATDPRGGGAGSVDDHPGADLALARAHPEDTSSSIHVEARHLDAFPDANAEVPSPAGEAGRDLGRSREAVRGPPDGGDQVVDAESGHERLGVPG